MIDVRAAAFVVSAIAMMVMPAQADSTDTEFASNGLDHLLYVSSSLEQGMDEIESLLGDPGFEPAPVEDQSRLDRSEAEALSCPECGHEWIPE